MFKEPKVSLVEILHWLYLVMEYMWGMRETQTLPFISSIYPSICLLIYICSMLCLIAQSCLTLCNPMTVAHQAPLSMGFFRQEYWSGLPSPPPGNLPNLGIEPRCPTLLAESLPSEPSGKWSIYICLCNIYPLYHRYTLSQ